MSRHTSRPVPLIIWILVAALVPAALVGAEAAYHPQFGYWVDAPTNWTPVDTGDSRIVAFTDPTERAILQIVSYDAGRFAGAKELAEHIRTGLGASGDTISFEYLDHDAALADYAFRTPQGAMRGYFIFIDHPMADHAAFAYVVESAYDDAHDLILSAVDSFAPTARARRYPGPVSEFLAAGVDDGWEEREIAGPKGPVTVRLDIGGVADSQLLIEREARILSLFQGPGGLVGGWQNAWRRFYRMIYRDSAHRLEPLARAVEAQLEEAGIPREEYPAVLLSWLQEFEFVRSGGLSDLAAPTTCLLDMAGDCDGLGLLYATVLHHLGFEAILMVSLEHAHAMVGVNVDGGGARFPYEGIDYLVAELTDDVEIGMIAARMADPADWIGIKLR